LIFGAFFAFLVPYHGKFLMFGISDVFEFCNHEQLVPLSAFFLSQASPPLKTKKTIQISYTSSKFHIDQVSSWQ
jgi:hypothetical protein